MVVVSAVTGLSAWADPVPDFRLKLSASLRPMGNLATFWRASLSATLNDLAAGHTVVDLLPNEHRAAWVPDPVPRRAGAPRVRRRRRPAGRPRR